MVRTAWIDVAKGATACRQRFQPEPRRVGEHTVVGGKGHPKTDGYGCNPSVAIVGFVTECVSSTLATNAQFRTDRDCVVVGLHDGNLRDAAFETSATELTPLGPECPEAQFHHSLKRDQYGLRTDEVAVAIGERAGRPCRTSRRPPTRRRKLGLPRLQQLARRPGLARCGRSRPPRTASRRSRLNANEAYSGKPVLRVGGCCSRCVRGSGCRRWAEREVGSWPSR